MKADTTTLLTIKNYAVKNKVTPAYIYKLIKEKRMSAFIIDGVQFIDTAKFPSIPSK
jgi:hypothetical protein